MLTVEKAVKLLAEYEYLIVRLKEPPEWDFSLGDLSDAFPDDHPANEVILVWVEGDMYGKSLAHLVKDKLGLPDCVDTKPTKKGRAKKK